MKIRVANYYKITLSSLYIALLVIWLFLQTITTGTSLSEDILDTLYMLQDIVWFIIRAFILLKICIEFEKRDIKVIPIIIIAIFSSNITSSMWISEILWFIIGAKYVQLDKTIKWIFIAELIAFGIIFFSSSIGVIENRVIIRNDSNYIRYSFGFNHPNALAARAFQLLCIYVYLRGDNLKLKDVVLFTVLSFCIYQITYSKSIAIMTILMCTCTYLLIYVYKENKKFVKTKRICEYFFKNMKYIIIVIPLVAIMMNFFIIKVPSLGTLYSRAVQSMSYYNYYGLTLFGQPLQINNTLDNFYQSTNKLYTLDNGYMYLLLGFGLISFLLFIYAEIILAIRSIKEKKYAILVIIVIYSIYGISETMMIRFTYNFSLFFLITVVWGHKSIRFNIR